jgi:hypothetical protein
MKDLEAKIADELRHAVGLRSQHHAAVLWALRRQEDFRREYLEAPDCVERVAAKAILEWGKIALEQLEWASHFEGRTQALVDLGGGDAHTVVTPEWAARVLAHVTQPNNGEWVPFGSD